MLAFSLELCYNTGMENVASTVTIDRSEYDNFIALKAEIAELKVLVEWYKNQLLSAKRRQFGVSSEKSDVNPQQLSLFGQVEFAPPPEPETEEITYKRKKQKGKREEDLANLPVERIDYELPESERVCPECGEIMRDIGVDVRRELKLIPAKIVLVEYAAHTYACRKCENTNDHTPIVKASLPYAFLPGSLASASMVAHIAYQKYVNGTPIYRIEKGFRYDGVNISRQTMTNWVISASLRYLIALYELMKRYLLMENYLGADETWIQVLREPDRAAQTKSYEWVYRTGKNAKRQIVIFEYRETRKQDNPREFLKDFNGFLHTDGYQAYHNLPVEITIVGCWAHVRRKFEDILKKLPKDQRKGSNAETGVAYINALFKLEQDYAELSPEERYARRLTESKPIAEAFFEWAASLGALPKSPLGEAVRYALSQQKWLMNVYLDGGTEISNNRTERAIRPLVQGRKVWLFSTSVDGVTATSILYSILETAKANDLHPRKYLEHLLTVLPNAKTSDLESLLPWSDTLPEDCRAPVTAAKTEK